MWRTCYKLCSLIRLWLFKLPNKCYPWLWLHLFIPELCVSGRCHAPDIPERWYCGTVEWSCTIGCASHKSCCSVHGIWGFEAKISKCFPAEGNVFSFAVVAVNLSHLKKRYVREKVMVACPDEQLALFGIANARGRSWGSVRSSWNLESSFLENLWLTGIRCIEFFPLTNNLLF